MNMSRIIVMMVAVMATIANVAAQDITGQVEQEQDSVSINDTIALKDVEVVTMRQLVKTLDDRVSYNVQADPEARTSAVLDVLRRVPLVSVDGQDNVRVNGSSSFKIYKNGHPDPALSSNPKEVLRAMPASMIKRIEVITEPGARYDAEGATAILNIVTVEGTRIEGVNGTVSASINTSARPTRVPMSLPGRVNSPLGQQHFTRNRHIASLPARTRPGRPTRTRAPRCIIAIAMSSLPGFITST